MFYKILKVITGAFWPEWKEKNTGLKEKELQTQLVRIVVRLEKP
jgi:hypothetical protein